MIRKIIYILFSVFVCLGVFAQRELTEKEKQERQISIGTKSATYPTKPYSGSIHVDRDSKYKNMSPEDLLTNVFAKSGACVSIKFISANIYNWNGTNWTNSAKGKGLAYFHKGESNFPMEEGLIMSPTDVRFAEGPNDENGTQKEGNLSEGDPDLEKLVSGLNVRNVAILEFDFVPTGSTVEFKYIFASEEYPNFVNSTVNDVFGFFVKEKGTSADAENIALLPTTETTYPLDYPIVALRGKPNYVVSINNVNNGKWGSNTYYNNRDESERISNSKYFVPNPAGSKGLEYDGHTVVLTATYKNMTPCTKTYRMKLAVANVGDLSHTSAVFLQANSFMMGTEMAIYGNGQEGAEHIYKDCDNNFIRLKNSDNVAVDVNLSYTGELKNGEHYTQENGTALPTSVTIPANSSIDIKFKPTSKAQNGKYFDVALLCPCSSQEVTTSTRIYIYDKAIPVFSVSTEMTSGKNTGKITVSASGGSGIYEYSIDNGVTWQDSNIFENVPTGTYQVKAKDKWSCHEGNMQTVILAHTIPVNPHIMGRFGQ